MVFLSLRAGFLNLWKYPRMIWLVYLPGLLIAVAGVFPVYLTLRSYVGDSLVSEELAGYTSMDFVFELFKYHPEVISTLIVAGMVSLLLWGLVSLFLSGGIVATFVTAGEKYDPRIFWGNAGQYFGRFVRLALMGLAVFLLLYLVPLLEKWIEKIIYGNDPYQYITYWGKWFRVIGRFVAILLFVLILDYSRIYAIIRGENRMRVALKEGIAFTATHLRRTFMLGLSFMLIGVVGLLIYNSLADLLSSPHPLVIFVLILLQQLFIVFLIVMR
ncbi:MAG: hypothetical protein D6681_03460, partial [Calditrichaeota bacterium]